jgi:hypothetical protein
MYQVAGRTGHSRSVIVEAQSDELDSPAPLTCCWRTLSICGAENAVQLQLQSTASAVEARERFSNEEWQMVQTA